ncbi:serine/threonine-protein kinase [Pedococcus sp. KACC 23699]|uniref:non-specific serine/threonine protein kinase n=1 Tax=Pedococcus sp. KACC 23699 TaxID=3149228 RepID=A0AAU7JVI7_9MICO
MQPELIAGRYEVVRSIGSGGMGTVWLCLDTVLGREVAVKRVGALPGDPAAAARAMREARIAASLNDANTVGVYDIVDQDDAHWLVMEYVEGQSLAETIRDTGALSPTRAAAIGSAVARALARAHQLGIVHRDIKPGNILMDRNGTPKISDFGIARAQTDDQLTQTGFMTGTPGYLSPELARGGDPTSASDVWALGATLYYAVEGHPPYESQANPLATLQAIASGEARPMEKAGPLGGAIAAMMNADPQQRWDMDTASERLSRIAAGDATMALPVGTPLGAGAAAALGGAAATEVIRDRVESTQQIEPAGPVAPAAAAAVPPGPPLGYDEEPPSPGDDRRRRRSPLVPILVGLAVLGVVALAYLLTRPNGSGGTDAQTPPVATTTAPAVTTTPSAPSSSSSTSSSSSSTSTTTTQTPSSTTTTTTTKAPDNAALAKFIKGYYGDVTKKNKRDDTFAELTPAYQAKTGRQAYESFWSGIKSVDVGQTQADAAVGTVIVQLTFHKADGSDSQEVHRITVEPNGKAWLISGDGQA